MRQLLLRVDDSLHARLTARARAERRSVNALANEILSAAATGSTSVREQVRMRAAARGVLAGPLGEGAQSAPTRAEREKILASTRGIGPTVDRSLAEDRDRT